jgi:TatD DNase family protein
MLVDTHAHLNSPQFSKDRDGVIQNARKAGVTRIVNVGTTLEVSRRAAALAQGQEGVYATAGFHPHGVEKVEERSLTELPGLLLHEKVVGVGETGLDFFRDYAPREVQERVFRRHIRLARETGLPLVVHSRGAEERVLDLLEVERADEVGGVLHCFGGDLEQAKRGVGLNFYLGFGGTVTFKKSSSLPVALQVPPDRLVLETDCPYLAPVPHRGRRNEPAYVRCVAQRLAQEEGVPMERLFERTTQNALRLFRLPGR